MKRLLLSGLASVAVSLPSFAITCESLQAQIESKIKASGVTQFSVIVVDAGSEASGKVVGTCALGQRKLVYVKTSSGTHENDAAPGPAASSNKTARRPPMRTECKDGSVNISGECNK